MLTFREMIRKGISTKWIDVTLSLAGMIKQSQCERPGSLWEFSQALLLILVCVAVCSSMVSAAEQDQEQSEISSMGRLVAGLDESVARNAFEASADNKQVIQLGQGSDGFLARFREPPSSYSMAVLGLVAKDSDLLDDNLATKFQEELAPNGWAVLLLSLDHKDESADVIANADAKKLSEGIQFLKKRNAESMLVLADQNTIDAALAAATQNENFISTLVLNDISLEQLSDEKMIARLQESRVFISDIVTKEFDKSILRQRRQWFEKLGLAGGYRLISAPSSQAGYTYIAKRTRAWLDKGTTNN